MLPRVWTCFFQVRDRATVALTLLGEGTDAAANGDGSPDDEGTSEAKGEPGGGALEPPASA